MTDPATQTATQSTPVTSAATLVVPPEVQQQFPELIDLVTHSESMNTEERQYWVNILPIMTPDQLQNLRDILTTERQQLAAIDAQYSKAVDVLGQQEFLKQVGQERQKRSEERTKVEVAAKTQEDEAADALLKNIENV